MLNAALNLVQIQETPRERPQALSIGNYDPTRTTVLRAQFAAEMGKRFSRLRGQIRKAIVDDDFFGLKKEFEFKVTAYAPFDFSRDAQKLVEFGAWLQEMINSEILEISTAVQLGYGVESAWTNRYIQTAYQKGVVRARNEIRAAGIMGVDGLPIPELETEDLLNVAFNQAFHLDRVGLMYTRTFQELKGVTVQMSTQLSRVLAQGLADGKNPYDIARLLTKTITGPMGDLGITDTLGRFIPAERRAKMLARTEIIRAHHMATIQEYKNWGLVGVKVRAEWTTAGDARVCEECSKLQEKVYTLKEIEPMLPRHPQCRCIALPWVDDGTQEDKASSSVDILSSGTIVSKADVEMGGINDSTLLSLAGGTRGIFKSISGENKLARTSVDATQFPLAYREAMAYRIDQQMGLNMVPPTVIRKIDGQLGSIQYWSEGDVGRMADIVDTLSPDDIYKMSAFDYLIGNTDRHHHNILYKNNKPVLIDNGFAFPKNNSELGLTVERQYAAAYSGTSQSLVSSNVWNGAVSQTTKDQLLKSLDQVDLADALEGFPSMSNAEIGAFWERWEEVKNAIENNKLIELILRDEY